MPSETIGKTIAVAAGVCVVCSMFVSTAAVYLKPYQVRNKSLDKQKNILIAAGLLEKGQKADIDQLFKQVESKWFDFDSDDFVDEKDVPKECLDQRKAAKNKEFSEKIEDDIAGIRRKPRYCQVYFTRDGDEINRVILPVYGKGLWSTLYGFLALDKDLDTVKSFGFYEHGETPGLGGEVDSDEFKDSWKNKEAFDENGTPAIVVVKGKAGKGKIHEVDGLSGATLTARGVQNLVRFWLSEEGYGPLLEKLGKGKGKTPPEGGDHG